MKKDRQVRTSADILRCFLGRLAFRGKVDMRRLTDSVFRRHWLLSGAVFEERGGHYVFKLSVLVFVVGFRPQVVGVCWGFPPALFLVDVFFPGWLVWWWRWPLLPPL